jgi:uncharacterized protein YdhG (YjbR/CyaY superfamily)
MAKKAAGNALAAGTLAVEAYLQALPRPMRLALERVRTLIREAAPDAEEVISYQMPGFRHQGVLVTYAAFTDHCSFFPMSPAVLEAHTGELTGFVTSKGTIRFTPEKPLPEALVKKIVRARVAENESRKSSKSDRKK